jgi:N4-gp56 family major capsid protein
MSQTIWSSSGSYFYSPKLSASMRKQALPFFVFRQFVDLKEGFGKNIGDTIQFTKRLRIDTAGTTLVETNTFPVNEIKFYKDSCTVNEFGNSVATTEKATTLSTFDLRNEYNAGLMDDYKNCIDRAVAAKFTSGEIKGVIANTATISFYTNGTATGTQSAQCSDKTIRACANQLKKMHVPKLGKDYVFIGATDAISGVYDYLQAVAQYAEPTFRYNDEIGRYYGVRFVEDNNFLTNAGGQGSVFAEAVMFGEESVMEAVALPEEVRYWEEDGGRSKKYAWYSILGFKKVWSLSTDDLNSTGKGIERILHITSA